MPEQTNMLVIELDRRHIGCLVKIVTERVSIIGELERIDHHDNAEWDLDGRPGRRDLMTELRISGWSAEVNPQQVVTVEEKPPALQRSNMDTLRRIAQAIEDRETHHVEERRQAAAGDVVQGEIVVHPNEDGYTPPLRAIVPAVMYAGSISPLGECGESEHGNWHCAPGGCTRPAECPLNVLDPNVKWEGPDHGQE